MLPMMKFIHHKNEFPLKICLFYCTTSSSRSNKEENYSVVVSMSTDHPEGDQGNESIEFLSQTSEGENTEGSDDVN